MRRILQFAALTALSGSALLSPLHAQEQNSPEPDLSHWYLVEVLIFRHLNPNDGGEQWPDSPYLHYPSRVIELNPNAADEQALTETTSPALQQPLFANNEFSQFGVVDASSPLLEETSTSETLALTTPTTGEESAPQTLTPQPYTRLDGEHLTLNDKASSLARSAEYRVMFHAGWYQPLEPRQSAPSILIRGGEAFDDHFELEGSIQLSLERYLHINTDLWLNRFTSNFGQAMDHWPLLPPAPTREQRQSLNGSTLFGEWQPTDFGQEFSELLDKRYVAEQTIVMRQHRRMRSDELHYLDHPRLGVLVTITPYTPPEEPSNEGEATE